MQQETALGAHRNTRSAMDRAIDAHFRHESRDDVDGVLASLSDDVDHDVVGSPTGPLRGKVQAPHPPMPRRDVAARTLDRLMRAPSRPKAKARVREGRVEDG